MKRILATTAIALSAMICVPVMAQQAPASPNVPNPSAPPAPEGPKNPRANDSMSGSSTMSNDMGTQNKAKSSTQHKNTGARAKKPREQDASPTVTPDAPSGPKGDSPNPVPKQ